MAILTFICYASLVYIVKCHPFFFQFHNVTILMSHFSQFFFDNTVIEVVSSVPELL